MQVLNDAGWRCVFCLVELQTVDNRRGDYATVDHIVPVSDGGTDDIENLRSCCDYHNKVRGNRSDIRDAYTHPAYAF